MPIGQESKPDESGAVRTAVVEARVDVRDLANFARYVLAHGETVRSKSDLVWKAFRSITESLRLSKEHLFESTSDALEFMTSLGLGTMNRPGRGGRPMNQFTLSRQIGKEDNVDLIELANRILTKHREGGSNVGDNSGEGPEGNGQ